MCTLQPAGSIAVVARYPLFPPARFAVVEIGITRWVTQTQWQQPPARCWLGMSQVLALVPFSRRTLYREMDEGRFPKAREIAPRRIAWYEDDVTAWQEELDKKVLR
ncbi:putative DNA-binding transcriptional regulator AlpA [Bradyrhizobium sp. JR3.5]